MDSVRLSLIDELSQSPVNALNIRVLCRDNPGLIATTKGIRLKVWSILLLGEAYENNENVPYDNSSTCVESQVLEADVKRTRSDMDEFRSAAYKKCINDILQYFCISNNVQYKQGMNELLAPFVYLNAPPKGNMMSYLLFQALLFRYLQRYFCLDESTFLFKSFRMFDLLLLYHDPQLALHLQEQDFIPELYSTQWFLTLFARALPMQHTLRLWDMIISVDDPAFIFFIGLVLLCSKRTELLLVESDRLPEIISTIAFTDEESIDNIVADAWKLYKSTPRCFVRKLRLCCINTTELTPMPCKINNNTAASTPMKKNKGWQGHEHDVSMATQSVGECVMLSPKELVDSLDDAESSQYVLLDVRSSNDNHLYGAGSIPKAVVLEPNFLDKPVAFDSWLQHFDSCRDLKVCIIDLPPVRISEIALWRRLLLGYGDGIASGTNIIFNNKKVYNAYNRPRDKYSQFCQEEEQVITEDSFRPAVALVKLLQQASFSKVCILEGGYPSLVDYICSAKGSLEPLVIDHDEKKWAKYLQSSGRFKSKTSPQPLPVSSGGNTPPSVKKVSHLSELEILEIGYKYALEMQHETTAALLLSKINKLKGVVEVAPSEM
jgi:hypothetical protein